MSVPDALPLPMRLYLDVIVFVFGACIGSFLNVCVYRIPRNRSVIRPGSSCPRCHVPIAWHDNLPIISWLVLRARCRHCGGLIRPRYVIIEALTGILFLLVWLKWGLVPRPLGLAPALSFAAVIVGWTALGGLILATFVDLERFIIPDRVSLGGIALGLALGPLLPGLHGQTSWLSGLGSAAAGAALGTGLLLGVAGVGRLIFKREAMGLGDVKLLGAIGAFFGWQAVIFSVMVSSLTGSLVGVTMVTCGGRKMRSRIPFGPFLAWAALLWLLWGPLWWQAYWTWLTPLQ